MPNKPLTTSKKIAILEQAIKMGAHIEINFHLGYLDDKTTVEEASEIFVGMTVTKQSHEDANWYKFKDGDDMRFEGAVFLPNEYELPAEWKDTGDVEKTNA